MEAMKCPQLVLAFMAFLFIEDHQITHLANAETNEPPQCRDAINLERKIGDNHPKDLVFCDNVLADVNWYKFGINGTIIPMQPVNGSKCATERLGWLNGSLPCDRYKTVPSTVCFGQNCSDGSVNINITLCKDTYVFQLPNLACTKFKRRYCGVKDNITVNTCTTAPTAKEKLDKEFGDLQNKVEKLANLTDEQRAQRAPQIIEELSQLTDPDNDKIDKERKKTGLSKEHLNETVQMLHRLVNLSISNSALLIPANNVLDERNNKSWNTFKDNEPISKLVTALEDYGFLYGETLKNKSNIPTLRNLSNIQLYATYTKNASNFPPARRKFTFPNASFDLSPNALPPNSSAIIVVFWYKTLNSFIPKSYYNDEREDVKSKIISASVQPKPRTSKRFAEPIRIIWNMTSLNDSSTCVFWKPELNSSKWEKEGCKRITDETHMNRLICECDHLTAFACMDISRDIVSPSEQKVLELISTIGCSVSLLGIILTILAHAILWRRLQQNSKSKVPAQVLIHLCVAIGMTDILAIMAGPAQNYEKFCTAVSILLYFFVLAVFGWMLCEGVVIYLQLVNVYTGLGLGGRHLKGFYVIGWGVPAAIVSLLVGLGDRDNFTTESACWCSGGSVFFWTFVAAVGLILLINVVIFNLALRSALSSSEVSTMRSLSAKKGSPASINAPVGSTLKKAKVAVKGSAVLLPLLGLTWIFGLLVFNRDTIVFKYLFAIFNSLQGLMIFVFHVLLNKRIHEAINREKKARKAQKIAMLNNDTSTTLQLSDTSPGKSSLSGTPVLAKKHNGKSEPLKNKYAILTGNSKNVSKSNAKEVTVEGLELSSRM